MTFLKKSIPLLSFVWRPELASDRVVETARMTFTGAIFEVDHMDAAKAEVLKSFGAGEIKVPADAFMDYGLENLLEKTDIKTLWVEYYPGLSNCNPDSFIKRIGDLRDRYTCIPVTGDLDLLGRMARMDRPPEVIALKGTEAAGFVSKETINILFSTFKAMVKHRKGIPDLVVWGGIFTPEGSAAFLSTGARGVVFESLHWLTDQVGIGDRIRQGIGKLRPENTSLIGDDLGVYCRFFDKGNSLAVKQLRQYAGKLSAEEGAEGRQEAFVKRISQLSIGALESNLSREELIPLGPEAAFAQSFTERFGKDTVQAFKGFKEKVEQILGDSAFAMERFLESPAGKGLGTSYPFIQGAMSWITDVPEFALAVADAGGLPTVALGLNPPLEVEEKFGCLKDVLGDHPYAVNLIALPENPYLDDHLKWVEEKRPPFVVIAAGDPALASRLLEKGVEVIYVAPEAGLLRMALEAGVRYLVLEGMESGGHVGHHSTTTLAQIALEIKRKEPALFKDRFVVLAGGIYNGETAYRAAILGADGIQMGTAYLATKEIVNTGALSPLYQRMIIESVPGETAVSGESIGLRVRSLKTSKVEAISAKETKFRVGQGDESSFRSSMEAMTAGSLLIAARGVDRPGGPILEEDTCLREGQFMSGAGAGGIDRVRTVAELHRELAYGAVREGNSESRSESAPANLNSKISMDGLDDRIAITGMAVVNSLGNSPDEIWDAVLAMRSGIVDGSPDKVDLREIYDPVPQKRGKTYCTVGAFNNINISRKELGISPHDFRTMAESTKLTMWLAQKAINDSGILDSGIPKERIGVVVSQNSGEAASTVKDLSIEVSMNHILSATRNIIQISSEQQSALEKELKSGLITVDDTTLLGRLNCAASGFICNKYGFMGPSHSVSAACATSLVALHSAIQMIKNGILDAAVIGGGEETLKPAHFLEFSALGALAGLLRFKRLPHEFSRPFDADRDGMVLGEGGGMVVIERESVARKRGASIHAFITGIGASNNHRGMIESLAETQEIAMRSSFGGTSYGPEDVGLVECHATGTIQGDVEEVKALRSIFPPGKPTILASFKSQIGHTLGASGLNSLIRGVKAMQAGIYPPTLNYQTPDPAIDLESTGFRVPRGPEEWTKPSGRLRRIMVNSFGFGGANYVVQLEESGDGKGKSPIFSDLQETNDLEAEKGDFALAEEVEGVSFFTTKIGGESFRLGVLADSESDARAKIAGVEPIGRPEEASPKYLRGLARQGVFAAPSKERPPELGLVFAGQGAQYPGMGKELYDHFPVIREWMDKVAESADFDVLDLLFNSREEDLQKTRWQQPAMFTLEYAMARHLTSLGVRPKAMAGHSLGELVALCIAGVFSFEEGFRIVNKRAQCMDKAAEQSIDPGIMIAVEAPFEVLEKEIAGSKSLYFTNFNSPRQTVLGGGKEETLSFMEKIQNQGYRATPLKVSMAFHSPVMKVIHDEMEEFMKGIAFKPPKVPVISNTTMEPFPKEPETIKKIVMAHLESPVHWMQNVQTLWDDYGIRLFVEVGPRSTLCNLIADTKEGAQCFQTCDPEEESGTYRAALARLFSLGHLQPTGSVGYIAFPEVKQDKLARDKISAIVQKEINSFILESFGKFLKPQIIEAVRRELSPDFEANDLERIIKEILSGSESQLLSTQAEQGHVSEGNKEKKQAIMGPEPPPPERSEQSRLLEDDYLEKVIRIIMDATGYERDEIEPDMDIRQDLAIRSSRLPVIMDAAERSFGISIKIEEFIDVRTVRDLGDRICELVHRDAAKVPEDEPKSLDPLASPKEPQIGSFEKEPSAEREGLKRFELEEELLSNEIPNEITVKPNQDVAVFNLSRNAKLADELAQILKAETKARPVRLDMREDVKGRKAYNLRRKDDAEALAQYLSGNQSLAGLVLVLDGESDLAFSGMHEVPSVLTALFTCLQGLMRSPAKEFCLLLQRGLDADSVEAVTAEGLTGMFLAAAHEYTSVLFRSIALDEDTGIKEALARGLDADNALVQIGYRGQEAFTVRASARPLNIGRESSLQLGPEDVVVVSGGAKGITSHLARALFPLGPKLVLLGRSEPKGSPLGSSSLITWGDQESWESRISRERDPESSRQKPDNSIHEQADSAKPSSSEGNVSDSEIEVTYYRCDVTDLDSVKKVMSRVIERYGRIDGIIHGAGILRDSFVGFMTPEDFSEVVKVKFLGAWNLYQNARDHGLRFMVGLSSLVAVLGNAGQVNYCAANRSMSALIRAFTMDQKSFLGKAFMLPPIEGAGMADVPEVKELIELRGMGQSYVHVSELSDFFCRELFLGQTELPWVMLARALPEVKTARVDFDEEEADKGEIFSPGIRIGPKGFPMIDKITRLEPERGEVEAYRKFSLGHDLWIDDHRPFRFLKYPIVSAIMGLETLMEAARVLLPYLNVIGVRQLGFEDILECPPGLDREAWIKCRKLDSKPGEVSCLASLSSQDISPRGRRLERWSTNYQGKVILGAQAKPFEGQLDFPVKPEELDSPSLDNHEVLRWYEKGTALKGRYRVVESVDGAGKGVIKGHMMYEEGIDFDGLDQAHYQYSPYLLEGLIHLVVIYVFLGKGGDKEPILPKGIEEMRIYRQCRQGERITLEARMRSRDTKGFNWDAQATDERGAVLMHLRDVRMSRIAE